MSFDYVRKAYGVPAKRGGKVEVKGPDGCWIPGKLVRADHHVIVRPDGMNVALRYHPADNDHLRYLPIERKRKRNIGQTAPTL